MKDNLNSGRFAALAVTPLRGVTGVFDKVGVPADPKDSSLLQNNPYGIASQFVDFYRSSTGWRRSYFLSCFAGLLETLEVFRGSMSIVIDPVHIAVFANVGRSIIYHGIRDWSGFCKNR